MNGAAAVGAYAGVAMPCLCAGSGTAAPEASVGFYNGRAEEAPVIVERIPESRFDDTAAKGG
jgi:hypothetical protein